MSKEEKLVDDYCLGCIHRAYLDGDVYFCDYIGDEGHRRPCPAGDGCTEWTDGVRSSKRPLSLK